jgi:transcriptional repressor NrdR
MQCPFCHENDTKVIDSRLVEESNQVRRRRQCLHCSERFTTYEAAELALPMIVKRDGRRSEFQEDKVRHGLRLALEKRPVESEKIEAIIAHVKGSLRACGEREVPALTVGNLIMDELRELDKVAYVRFASVYRDFQDVDEFRLEIDRLLTRK